MGLKKFHIFSFCLFLTVFTVGEAQFRLTENLGQWESQVLFKADLKSAQLYISKGELTYLFFDSKKLDFIQHNQVAFDSVDVHCLKLKFLNSNPNASYVGEQIFQDYSNYFIGNNPAKWKGHVKSYHKLFVKDIYPGIDFEMFAFEGRLKYNLLVNPGADIKQIQMQYLGADSLYIDNSELHINYRFGEITELKPLVYEQKDQQEKILQSAFQLENSVLSFDVSSKRNSKNLLVIDPILVFSTFSGSTADNFGYTATYDDAGHGYAGGTVFGTGFPTTTGAYQLQFAGGNNENRSIGYIARDCGIIKYSKDGKQLIYSTYIGGTFSNEQPHSMVVNSKNELLIMGTTKSSDFPIGIAPAFDGVFNGLSDVFVVKLSEDGSNLIAGTFVGGIGFDGLNGDRPSNLTSPLLYNYADDFRGEIIVDANDNVFVATTSNSTDFPIVNGFDASHGGKQDGVVFMLDANLSDMLFSSFIGGSGDDAAYSLDLGTHNDLYVTGGSNTSNFGYGGPGNQKTNNGGSADGYLLRINLNDFSLMASTFIGSSSYDQTYFVKTDKYGKPFVYGQTEGIHQASADVYSVKDAKMFIKKYDFNCTTIEIETTFGALNKNKPDISPTAFLIDECERIFISGWGGIHFTAGFDGGGTFNMPLTSDAYQKTTDGYDFYLAVFSKNLQELQYATFFGGKGNNVKDAHEHVDGGTSRFDKKGIIYQSVCAGCQGQSFFPTSPGVWSNTNNSSNCNNALFKFDFENLNRKPIANDSLFDVFANDVLDFEIVVSDPDRGDSLRMVLTGDMFTDPNFPKPLPQISGLTPIPGKNAIKVRVTWQPTCDHAALDTMVLKVKVYDQGCPTQDSNQALIKIVVKDPPLTITPETMCLFFKEDGSIKLSWKEFDKNRFFSHILLFRQDPNGSIKILDSIFKNTPGEYRDLPSNPTASNYQYYMVGYNICGKAYDAGWRINTTKEFNVPIDSTYIHYATVEMNKNVKVNWFVSKEDDFGSYDVFRADNVNGVSSGYRKIKTIYDLNDTNYLDEKVEVDKKSYCYKIGVNDKCGHISKPSNEACNIVLTGKVGHLFFDLDWMPYRDWAGGVRNYELQRRVDTGSLRFLTNTNLMRVHHDEDLDLWWGAYYYVVRAFEDKTKSGIGYNAVSLSNEIRLIQPPLVFVPNAFSPNDDGSNDVWGVSHAFVKDFRMQVYNRWGEKVWDNDFKGLQWNGISHGISAENDVFIWIVTYRGWDNKFYTQKGTVTVLR